MDIVTHGLLGAALGYALSGPDVAKRASLTAGVAALAPDLDVLIRSSHDPLLALEYHRHFSHSLFFAPVGATLVAIVMWLLLRRNFQFVQTWVSAFIGYLSAILLDACTSYGTHLLWPFTEARTSWNIISIVDPVFSAFLLVALILGIFRGSRGFAQLGIYACLCYLCVGYLQHERAQAVVQSSADAQRLNVDRIIVKPSFANILLWRTLTIKDGNVSANAVRLNLFGESKTYPGESTKLVTDTDIQRWANGSYKKVTEGRRFLKLSDSILVHDENNENFLGDVRFALLPNSLKPLWGIENVGNEKSIVYLTQRKLSDETRTQFMDMLFGR